MVMRISPSSAAVALVLSISACDSHSASEAVAGKDSVKARLLAAADVAAKTNGGGAKRVEAVETTRGKAAEFTGHSNLNQTERVWVVQVSGDDYHCWGCPHPQGAATPSGRYLTLVLRGADYHSTDFGITSKAADLAVLGNVEVLRHK